MQRLVDQWRESGMTIQSGVGTEAISRFESERDLLLPEDLRRYFQTINGTGQVMDNNLLRFWLFEEVQPVAFVSAEICPDCYVFADYCIDCWHYAIELTRDNSKGGAVFEVTGGSPPRTLIATSFREFIHLYLTDPTQVV